jgi:hypothetical protein
MRAGRISGLRCTQSSWRNAIRYDQRRATVHASGLAGAADNNLTRERIRSALAVKKANGGALLNPGRSRLTHGLKLRRAIPYDGADLGITVWCFWSPQVEETCPAKYW